jgi:hypothetical protein
MGFDGFFLSLISFGEKFSHEIVASCGLRVQRKSLTQNSQFTTQFAHRLKSVATKTKPAKEAEQADLKTLQITSVFRRALQKYSPLAGFCEVVATEKMTLTCCATTLNPQRATQLAGFSLL